MPPSYFGKFTAASHRAWSAFKAWRGERTAIVELAVLDDRELRDIGIHRSEIAYAVRFGSPNRVGMPAAAASGAPARNRAPGALKRPAPKMKSSLALGQGTLP